MQPNNQISNTDPSKTLVSPSPATNSKNTRTSNAKIFAIIVGSFAGFILLVIVPVVTVFYFLSVLPSPSVDNAATPIQTEEKQEREIDVPQNAKVAIAELEKAQTVAEAKLAIQKVLVPLDINLITSEKYQSISPGLKYEAVSSQDLESFKSAGKILIQEISIYPPEWLEAIKVHNVGFVKDLTYKYTDEYQSVAGLAIVGRNSFFIDISIHDSEYGDSKYYQDFARATIHHEFYHLADWEFGDFEYDYAWLNLNKEGFKYESQKNSQPDVAEFYDDSNPEGFTSGYALQSPEEDKAETFTYLVAVGNIKELYKRLDSDEVLNAKVKHIKKVVNSRVPAMNESWFAERKKAAEK